MIAQTTYETEDNSLFEYTKKGDKVITIPVYEISRYTNSCTIRIFVQLFLFAVTSCFLFKLFQFFRHVRYGFGVGCGVKHFLGFGQQGRAAFKLFQRQCRDGTRTEVIHRNAQLGPCFQPFPFGLRDVHDGAVARGEVAVGLRVLHECEVFQVRALADW